MVTPSLSADTRYILLLLVFYFWCGEHYNRDNDSISFLRVQQTHTKDPLFPPTSNSSLWKMGATSGAAFRRKNKTNQQNKNKKQWIIIFITIRQELINANGLYCGIFKQKKKSWKAREINTFINNPICSVQQYSSWSMWQENGWLRMSAWE